MPIETVLAPLIASCIFAYLYTQERALFVSDDQQDSSHYSKLREWVWLILTVGFMTFAMFNEQILTNVNALTGDYTYLPASYLQPFGVALGSLFVLLIALYIYDILKTYRSIK